MLLSPGTEYELDGVKHQIPPTERFIGRIPKLTPRKETFLTRLKEIMVYFHNQCEIHDITYLTTCGTLLGCLKLQGMFPWDTDIDVSVPLSEVPKIKEVFRDGPFKLISFPYGFKLCVRNFPYYPFVDIMVTDKLPGSPPEDPIHTFCYPLSSKGIPTFKLLKFFPKKKHPESMIYPLRLYEFEGIQVWGPRDAYAFCETNYGPDCFTTSFVKRFDKHFLTAVLRI